jgi:hypothetical protein
VTGRARAGTTAISVDTRHAIGKGCQHDRASGLGLNFMLLTRVFYKSNFCHETTISPMFKIAQPYQFVELNKSTGLKNSP